MRQETLARGEEIYILSFMKRIIFILLALFIISCHQSGTTTDTNDSGKSVKKDTNIDDNKNNEKIVIIKGWGDYICKDSLYSLQITGNKDSIDYYSPSVSAGARIYNRKNGKYDFQLIKDNDTLKITIFKTSHIRNTKKNIVRQYRIFKIPVKKQ